MSRLEYILSKIFLNICFYLFYLIPVNNKKVTFSTPRSELLDGNIKYIYRELKKQRPDLKIVMLFETYSYSLKGKIEYLFRLVKGTYHLATSRVFIVDNAYFPIHVIKHKKKTVVIQVWHAAGALKKFGKDVDYEERQIEDSFIHKNYDYVIMGSEFSKKHYATAMGVDEDKILVLGSARTDLFFNSETKERVRKEFYEKYPYAKDKKIILYAPTFRSAGKEKYLDMTLDMNLLEKELGSEYVLIYKPHLNVKEDIRNYNFPNRFVIYVDKNEVLNKLLTVTDVFITDYSSAIIEYALMKKPLILHVYDIDEYDKKPGFYLNYETDMIGTHALNTKDIINIVKNDSFNFDSYDDFIDRFYEHKDGKNSKRIAEFIISTIINRS